jgi:hypothetical protein
MSEIEHLGCWSTRYKIAKEPNRAENVVRHLGLDVAYTLVPQVTRLKPLEPEDNHVVFSQLAATIYPVRPIVSPQSLPSFAPSPLGHSLSPDDKLACFDFLYYATSGVDVYEWRFSWSPAWQSIARHLKFTQPMLDLGQEYLRTAFSIHESGNELPPVSGRKVCPRNLLLELMALFIIKFIAVHVRRGDFSYFCSTDHNPGCFPSLSAYKKHVDDIVLEIQSSHDIAPHALQVLVMSGNYICQNLFLSLLTNYFYLRIPQTKYRLTFGRKCEPKAGFISIIPRNAPWKGLASGILHLSMLSHRATLWDLWELRIRHLVWWAKEEWRVGTGAWLETWICVKGFDPTF